jgi:hydrogenase maturation protease
MSASPPRPVVVLGIGNILMRDDGVGVHALDALRRAPLPRDVDVVDGGTAGADLVEAIIGRRKVIVIDAFEGGGAPGEIYRLELSDLEGAKPSALSIHEVDFLDALSMARNLGSPPEEVVVFGVEPGEICLGLEMTRAVKDAIPRMVALVLEELGVAPTR